MDLGIVGRCVVFGLFVFSVVIYFGPTIVAIKRRHPQMLPIGVLNLLAGWTFIGWVVAMSSSVRAVPSEAVGNELTDE